MFIPGETITHEFRIPFAGASVSRIYVTYRQNDQIVLVKTINPGQIESPSGELNYFRVTLSQQESLLFQDKAPYYVQLNVIMSDNETRAASTELRGTIGLQQYRKVTDGRM